MQRLGTVAFTRKRAEGSLHGKAILDVQTALCTCATRWPVNLYTYIGPMFRGPNLYTCIGAMDFKLNAYFDHSVEHYYLLTF